MPCILFHILIITHEYSHFTLHMFLCKHNSGPSSYNIVKSNNWLHISIFQFIFLIKTKLLNYSWWQSQGPKNQCLFVTIYLKSYWRGDSCFTKEPLYAEMCKISFYYESIFNNCETINCKSKSNTEFLNILIFNETFNV